MAQQYDSQVQLAAFRVAIPFPLVECEGENLALHFHGRQDLPPLIAVKRFTLCALHFISSATQRKIDNMSKRSLGKPQEAVNPGQATSEDDVSTELNGDFHLANGILSFSGLHFEIPGTEVQLGGTYALNGEMMNFRGKVRLQAKLSQTTTGVKSFVLKLADPLFSKPGNGAVLPIRITGTAQHPHNGL